MAYKDRNSRAVRLFIRAELLSVLIVSVIVSILKVGWLVTICGLVIIICAVMLSKLIIAEAFEEEAPTDLARQASQEARCDAAWVRKYFGGEFDPKPDGVVKSPTQSPAVTALSGESQTAGKGAGIAGDVRRIKIEDKHRIRKFVI